MYPFLFPINVLNGAVGVVIVPTPVILPVFVLSARLVHWRLWPLVALGPASRAWLGLCLLDIEIDESLRPDCPAHMCRSAGMLSRALWLFASVASLPVLAYL